MDDVLDVLAVCKGRIHHNSVKFAKPVVAIEKIAMMNLQTGEAKGEQTPHKLTVDLDGYLVRSIADQAQDVSGSRVLLFKLSGELLC
jgi:hypothetical protein